VSHFDSQVIGFVGSGRSRAIAIRVECGQGTTLLRRITPEYVESAKKVYDDFIARAIGRGVAQVAAQPKSEPVPAPTAVEKPITVIRKPVKAGCGQGSCQVDDEIIDYLYTRIDNCWKTYRRSQYR